MHMFMEFALCNKLQKKNFKNKSVNILSTQHIAHVSIHLGKQQKIMCLQHSRKYIFLKCYWTAVYNWTTT